MKLCGKRTKANFRECQTWKIATAKNADFLRTRNFAKKPNLDLKDSKRQFKNQLNFGNWMKGLMQALANGLRYPRVGGRGQCLRCRKSPKPEKCL